MNDTVLKSSSYGKVTSVKSLLVEVEGLTKTAGKNWITFENGELGQIISFDDHKATIMALGQQPIQVGSKVYSAHSTPQIEVSLHMLGQCIDPLGSILVQKKPTKTTPFAWALADEIEPRMMPLHPPTPQLESRTIQSSPLETGVGVVDILTPLARGQRELIVGDQKTGKTAFLNQLLLTQTHQDTVVIWAAIGKRSTEIKQLLDFIHLHHLDSHMVVVATTPQNPDSLIYLTPFTAMSIAEYFRDLGQNTLVVLDDLSTHAKFYREISLLARRFPGRDSYPGDVFYTHAHLLERAGVFHHPTDSSKTVSISCLPVAETTDSDLTNFIVSNLISITDGHLLFDSSLFSRGHRPAIDTALSVTRIGRQAQSPLARSMSRQLTSFLTSYAKLLSLTHFGAELSPESQEQIKLGESLQSLFNQPMSTVMPIPVLLIMVGGLWLKWWPEISTNDLNSLRDEFIKQWADPQYQAELEPLLLSPDMTAFLKALPQFKPAIIRKYHSRSHR